MIKKISAFFLATAFLLNGAGTIFANPDTKTTVKQTASLAALLPASEGVMTLNMRRLVSETLPQVLSSNQLMLNEILGKFDEVKAKTGLDLRQFEQIAVGVSGKNDSAGAMHFEPVILARGTFNAGAMLALTKIAVKGKYREEKFGDRTVYIFSVKQAVAQNAPKTAVPNSSVFSKIVNKMFSGLSDEIAVTSFDNNTLAIGSPSRLRETFDTKARVGADVLNLVNRKPNALMSFGAKLPNGLAQIVDFDNDEIGKNLQAIRQISGAIDVSGGNAAVSLTAKTLEAAQAQDLQETLEGLQMVGKAFLGGAKGADKKVYARMIENAKITHSGSEIMLDLQVAQSDIDILVGAK